MNGKFANSAVIAFSLFGLSASLMTGAQAEGGTKLDLLKTGVLPLPVDTAQAELSQTVLKDVPDLFKEPASMTEELGMQAVTVTSSLEKQWGPCQYLPGPLGSFCTRLFAPPGAVY
ncbi:hypothetical protein [Nitratireductor sp.]|uniref:hypothetical protein n=2 Tax=Pseudomonadota TaxID=1224 RepID=UPI00262C3BC4|nr:hypothetical protein [Nitratireductor sp.]MCV0379773.1 hypothetical protein [Nitratireductor sp.]